MAELVREIKAITENMSMKIDLSGKDVELIVKFEGTTTWINFKDLMEMLDFQAQFAECLQTVVNELNQAETVNLVVGEEKR